jgi:hypothetical protein
MVMRSTSFNRSMRSVLGRAAAMLAFVAQLALIGACLGEGRAGLGYGPHVDPGGTSTHYVHDEAVCAACQARTLHGVAALPHPPAVIVQQRDPASIAVPESYRAAHDNSEHLSRAPPALS